MKTRTLLWAIAALFLASCSQVDVDQVKLKDDHVLTANIENAGPTKTAVENGGTKVLWGVGEEISVFLGTTAYKFKSLNTSPASSADFEGTPSLKDVSDSNPILALSPYKSDSKVASGIIYYNLPATQQAVENTYDPDAHALVAYSPTVNLSFYNVTSGIRFTLTRSDITEITLKSNDAMSLAGDLQIKASGSTPTIQNITSPSTIVKLLPPAGGFKKGVWYYITTIPAKLTKGFTIDFKAGALEASFTTSSVVTMKRGGYGSISEIDKNLTFADPTIHVTGVTLDKTSLTMAPGETATLVATVAPDNATDKSINWSSSDDTVASVDQNGKVTAKKAGTTVIVALTNDGYKTATCKVTVAPPVSDLRTQYAESASGYQTFGKVIHYKYGTKYGSTANEFYVVPMGNDGNAFEDSDAAHFSATSSKTDNVSVSVVKVGNGCAFLVKPLKDPTKGSEAWSDLTFEYTPANGSKLTKAARIVVVPSSASSAFAYKLRLWDQLVGTVDVSGNTFSTTISKANDTHYSNLNVAFNMSGTDPVQVPEKADMATYSFTSSNSSIVNVSMKTSNSDYGSFPSAELTYKSPGKANVVVKYTDYKGNKLEKTLAITVKKNFIASGDYIRSTNSSYTGNNSTSNRDYVGVDYFIEVKLYKSSGQEYTADELTDITWSSSNTSVATVTVDASVATARVVGKAAGDVTITATGKDGSKAVYYMTVYKRITSITPNSTTYKIGLGSAHTMNYTGEDFTIVPSNATYQSNSDFKWQSSNSNVVSVGNTNGIISGDGVGTATISAAPKPWYANYMTVREVQVVDYRLKVTSTTSKLATLNKLYANSDDITIEVGSTVNVCYASTSGTSYTWNGTCGFSTASTKPGVVIASGGTKQQYAVLQGIATGDAYIDLDYTGSNGRILQRYHVKVVPKFTWASGDIASNSNIARTQTSPYFLKVGENVSIYGFHGSSQYTASQADAIAWSSVSPSLATVSPESGYTTKVTGKANGYAEIKGMDSNGNTRSFWAYVYTPVTSVTPAANYVVGVTCNPPAKQFSAGNDFTISPSNANPFKYLWESGNTEIATVDEGGKVTVNASKTGSADIRVRPYPNSSFYKARTVKVVYWRMYASYSACTSSGTIQQSDGTNGDHPYGYSGGSDVIKIDKGKQVNLKFYNISDGHKVGDAAYSVVNSNTSVVKMTTMNYDYGTNGSYVMVEGLKSGTSTVTLTISGNNTYFSKTFTIQVL